MHRHLFKNKCRKCKKIYFIHFYRKNISKFCSYKCKWESLIGIKHSDIHKKKISLSLKGRKLSKEHKNEISKARTGKPLPHLSGKNNSNWRGGILKHNMGYILKRDYHRKSYILKHRLVMEKHIGRILKPKEVVHHINGNPSDNRIKNLMLFKNNIEHMRHHATERRNGVRYQPPKERENGE